MTIPFLLIDTERKSTVPCNNLTYSLVVKGLTGQIRSARELHLHQWKGLRKDIPRYEYLILSLILNF